MLVTAVTNRAKLLALAALVALALPGCGVASSSSSVSAQDPADVVPAGALIYISLPARLQSPEGPAFAAVLSHLVGNAAQAKLDHLLNKLAASAGTTYAKGIRPWLGSHVGIAMTQFPNLLSLVGAAAGRGGPDDVLSALLGSVAVIVPTDNPSAASNFLKLADKRGGVPLGLTAVVHGNDLLVGGDSAVSAVEHTTASTSLAGSAGYSAMLARLASQPIGSIYVSEHLIKSAVSLAAIGGKLPGGLLSSAETELSKVPADAAELEALTATDTTLQLDVLTNGFPATAQRVPADVGTLTSASWLALSTGSIKVPASALAGVKLGFSTGLARQHARLQELGPMAGRLVAKLEHSETIAEHVIGALGPISLSISGTSLGRANLGFTMAPSNTAAAKQLLSLVFGLARSDPNNGLKGSATAFMLLTKHRQVLHLRDVGGRIQALIGYPSASAFLNSSSRLANTASYRAALAQLQAGAGVPLYLNFGPLASLMAAERGKRAAMLRKLSYLIVGHTPGDTRIVLGLS
jgi:hypothetical protein